MTVLRNLSFTLVVAASLVGCADSTTPEVVTHDGAPAEAAPAAVPTEAAPTEAAPTGAAPAAASGEAAPSEAAPAAAPAEAAPAAAAAVGWADVSPIFTSNCAPCHSPGKSGGLKISYENMVGVAAHQAKLNQVEPGSPEQSYVWHKLNGTQASVGGSGGLMPTKGKLPAADLEKIKAWITAGAPQ
ncbi:MAG: c-type cytochrome [Deltaproteobacteria bacterium]|nr:c-type cytochrome [Deltaproteobacteria bacterium]